MSKNSKPSSDGQAVSHGFQIGWPTLSIILAIVGLASLGTLVVVVSVKDVDLLATVALALAILSFAAQLIVSMIQTESNAKLNGDTQAALASIRATADALLSNQSDQFNQVLGAALRLVPAAVENATAEVVSEDESGTAEIVIPSAVAIQDSLSRLIRENYATGFKVPKFESPRLTSSQFNALKSLSSDERKAALDLIGNLDQQTVDTFVRVARAVRVAERNGLKPLAKFKRKEVARDPMFSTLMDQGLIEEISAPADGEMGMATYQLTANGRLAARLLV